ncbi:MAG: hypothetical protein H0T62_03625 [Parachlamydiaceae bacterium]|nr:hypothetical protein [Parachlamydiaceae bacterium]
MDIDIDKIEFTNKTEYRQEVPQNPYSNNYSAAEDSRETIYTVPVGVSQVSYSLNSNKILNDQLAASRVTTEEEGASFSVDASIYIDQITKEISDLSLPSAETFFQSNGRDDYFREQSLNICQQMNEILKSNSGPASLIKEIKGLLVILAEKYLNEFFLSEYYTFEHLSLEIDKIDHKEMAVILQKFQKIRKLNESIIRLKGPLIQLFNSLENDRLMERPFFERFSEEKLNRIILLTENFLKEIEIQRYTSKKEFFSDYMEKTAGQSVSQTMNAIYLHDLNKVKEILDLMSEKLRGDSSGSIFKLPFSHLRNKKVVIFTCSYGNGHKITAAAIQQTLKKSQAHPVIYDLSTGPLLGKDRWRQLFKLFGIRYDDHHISSVDIFNEILRNQFYFIVNTKDAIDAFLRKMLDVSGKDGVSPSLGQWVNSWEKTQVRELLMTERPDHIITTYHMDLNPILEVAEELGIPVLHIPTDYNMKFKEVFDKTSPKYPYFKSLIPNDGIEETLQTQIPLTSNQLVEQIGIPLRHEFYDILDAEEILAYRRGRGIADNEKILYLSTGGNGQNLPHPELLANSLTWDIPLRLLVVAGKNRDFVTHLQKMLTPQNGNSFILKGKNPYVTVEIVTNPDSKKIGTETEFFIQANQLSKLLDISDLSIAKAGGLSVAELLFKGVPIVFDHRVNPFSWELFNMQVATQQKMGVSNYYLEDLESDLKKGLALLKGKNRHFYFESALELFSQTVSDQIQQAESDLENVNKRGHLFSEKMLEVS